MDKNKDMQTTTFIIPSVGRATLQRAIQSAEIAQGTKVKSQDASLHMIDKHKIGPAEVRNRLIKQAKTEWVSFLDDDDTVTNDYVQRLEEEIAAHPEADVIHFREYFLRGHLLPNWPVVEWGNIGISFSVKRELALKFPFPSIPYEDYEFVEKLDKEGYKVYFSSYMVYRVRH